jgi:glycosyltransferase involved in cell wall biosynthesis
VPRERLLIFVVAYEAEATLKDVLDRVPADVLHDFEVEILIVDDASDDRTFEIGNEYAVAHPELPLTVLRNSYNQGYGGNQKIGYAFASLHGFGIVALLHGDGQYAPEVLRNLVEPVHRREAEAVFGSRMMKRGGALAGGMPLYKYVGNRILTTIQNTLLRRDLSEYHSGYRVYSVAALDQIHYQLNANGFHFDTQIILQLMNNGARIVEVAIPTYYGDEISRVNGLRYAWDVVVNTVASFTHGLGLFQQRRLDPVVERESPYRPKLGFTSSHSLAVDAVDKGSRVIDLGVGSWEVAKAMADQACSVTGVGATRPDIDIDGVGFLLQDLNEPLEFDVASYDTIVMLDVIEHLSNPEDFFVRLRGQFGHEPKTLILSTPNIAFGAQRISLLFGQFNYGRSGILDRTHTRLFTFRTLRHLLRDAGFNIRVIRGVPAPFPLVTGKRVGISLLRINEMLIRISRTLFSFQIFVIAESTPSVDFLVAEAKRSSQEAE